MRVAFYKATRPGLPGVYNRVIRGLTGGPYSHCELELAPNVWGSSSYMDGGVRLKEMALDPVKWDVLDIGDSLDMTRAAMTWFVDHNRQPYDLAGNLHCIWPLWPHRKSAWFCSEAVAAALGMSDPASYHPNSLAEALLRQQPATS